MRKTAVVTGASSGIGEATARRLAAEGFDVVAAARRRDRLDRLAAEVPGIRAATLDVTSQESVDAFAASLDRCDVLVNNAGGAIGLEPVATGKVADWQRMYDVNVLGTLRVTQALLPRLIESGDGVLLMLTSVAGLVSYEGGGGYNAAKHAQTSMTEVLRLELVGQPVRIVEIAPGMVHTEEFSLNRFRGDATAAGRVYEGVPGPLSADDVADAIAWSVTRPAHVNIDRMVIRPRAQAAQHKIHRV
ncbi:NADP-dependent 3-hydroxy acid dehydrogenase YdfG [Streptosporangium becharense]|uniref:NADP-dependent 3-hydroxy acid dehydrogenase YdfG n=1 Tax=Streptosporangium becharense TaxID=1816182 RepID=A0A7W9IFT2_9ACTN|nr:SDR family oxidoreductase [Streptosporangium becharense]MBB2909271.1 NADP-dependent 3-hydroxy acid dehydrogenase YdfG [Streptosporangium becharense]MBB5819710.1 NADP-dependent 3-hydroxy acid dehydrogenase YdfG [Streptosporangium becharense]